MPHPAPHLYPPDAMTDDDSSEKRAKADAVLKAITKAEWERIHKELVLFGFRRTKSMAEAKDLAQEAMMRVLDARWGRAASVVVCGCDRHRARGRRVCVGLRFVRRRDGDARVAFAAGASGRDGCAD